MLWYHAGNCGFIISTCYQIKEKIENSSLCNRCCILYLIILVFHGLDIYKPLTAPSETGTEKKYKAELEIGKKAEAANEAETEFLQRMSQGYPTPINGICGMDRCGGALCR